MTKVQTVRAVVQVGLEKIEIQEFPRPVIGPDAALIRIEANGLCGTDLAQMSGKFYEMGMADMPCIPGHELLGIIDEIGPVAARRWRLAVGDRVAVEPHLACGACPDCVDG